MSASWEKIMELELEGENDFWDELDYFGVRPYFFWCILGKQRKKRLKKMERDVKLKV